MSRRFASACGYLPWMTLSIWAVCQIVFAYQERHGYIAFVHAPDAVLTDAQQAQVDHYNSFTREYGNTYKHFTEAFESRSPERLLHAIKGSITAIFCHGNSKHLNGNMAVFLLMGTFAEMMLGRWRFLLLFLLTGIIGGLPVPSECIGASGAINGLAGFLATAPFHIGLINWATRGKENRRPKVLPAVLVGHILYTLISLLLLLPDIIAVATQAPPTQKPAIAHTAHLAGFAVGAVFALVTMLTDTRYRQYAIMQWQLIVATGKKLLGRTRVQP